MVPRNSKLHACNCTIRSAKAGLMRFLGNLPKLNCFHPKSSKKPISHQCSKPTNQPYTDPNNCHKDSILGVGLSIESLASTEQAEEEEKQRENSNGARGNRDPARKKNHARRARELIGQEQEEEERELRLKACTEAFQRLEELEGMESLDLEHVSGIREIWYCYSQLRCLFFIDIANRFIVDVCDEILKQNLSANPQL